MNKGLKLILHSILVIGFTFSYFVLTALISETVSKHILVRMSLWMLITLLSYSIYSRVTIYQLLPPALHWKTQSKWLIFIPLAVLILMGLAILFPSPKHDRFDMLYIVVIAVIGEEILFRGLLWDIIDDLLGDKIFLGLSDTIWLTSIAFGVMHLQYHHFQIHLVSITQMSYSFGIGLLLGVIRKATKSVVPPMFAHSAFNSLFNLLLATMR